MSSAEPEASAALYYRVGMTVEDVTMSHVTELAEIDTSTCRIQRILEYRGDQGTGFDAHALVGWAERTPFGLVNHGLQALPSDMVPHPSTYAAYADIDAVALTPEEFEAYWAQRDV